MKKGNCQVKTIILYILVSCVVYPMRSQSTQTAHSCDQCPFASYQRLAEKEFERGARKKRIRSGAVKRINMVWIFSDKRKNRFFRFRKVDDCFTGYR